MRAQEARRLLLGLWCISPAAAHQHAHQHAQHSRQHQHQRQEPNLSASPHNPSGSLHNHTALPTWASHLPRLLVERRRVTELNRLTLICVLSMGAIISIGTMVVIVQARWPARGGGYQECLNGETTELADLADQSKELLGDASGGTPPARGTGGMSIGAVDLNGAQMVRPRETLAKTLAEASLAASSSGAASPPPGAAAATNRRWW